MCKRDRNRPHVPPGVIGSILLVVAAIAFYVSMARYKA